MLSALQSLPAQEKSFIQSYRLALAAYIISVIVNSNY